jgi:uncharacterized integral membrane protein
MRWARRVLWLALVGALLVGGWRFASRNGAEVQVDLLFVELAPTPLWTVLLGAFALGAAAAGLAALWEVLRLGLVSRRYRKAMRRLEAEVHELRNLPLAAEANGEEERRAEEVPSMRVASRDG